jgi:hypothetical protein
MKTRHKCEGGAGQAADKFGADGDNLTQLRSRRKRFIALTGHLAGKAADAFLGILKEIVTAHVCCLHKSS